MNNNFDELILKRRARGRAQTASMDAHGGHARLMGRERGMCTPRGAQMRGAYASWGAGGRGGRVRRVACGQGASTATRHVRSRSAYVGAHLWRRVWGAHGREPRGWRGRKRTCPPMGAGTSQVRRV
jgi:hypothetical protein